MPTRPDTDLHYELIRSRRRTVSLIVRDDGSLEIRCPLTYPRRQVDSFVQDKIAWISRKRLENRLINSIGPLSAELRAMASDRIRDRLRDLLSAYPYRQPSRFIIRDQRSRWGSCSNRGSIAINCRCDQLPEPLQDYVILHELCHLVHMNHGAAFWQLLESCLPDARQRRQALSRYRLVQEDKP